MATKCTRLLLTLGVAGVIGAVPAPALAHGGSGSGSDDGQVQTAPETHSGRADDATTDPAESHGGGAGGDATETHGGGASGRGSSGSGHSGGGATRTESYELRGTVASVDPTAQTVVVAVKKANHGRRGRRLVAQTITFDLSSARIDAKDVNGDGVRNLSDIAAGDVVEVRADLPRSGTADLSAPIVASRINSRSGGGHADANHGADDAPNHG